MPDFKIIAHRGHGPTSPQTGGANGALPNGIQPENSMNAFRYALDTAHADAIELDVYLSSDGIPMVIHDDDLNINVFQADRKSKNLGLVSQTSCDELQDSNKFPLGPNGEQIPTLQQVIDYVSSINRQREPHERVLINVELKGSNVAEATWQLVEKNISRGNIKLEDISYCSFDYDELRTIRKLDNEYQSKNYLPHQSRIAPGIKTALLYGAENVQKPHWSVPFDCPMKESAITELAKLHQELNFCAMDTILWDIEYPIVEFVKKQGIELHASTSNFRPKEANLAFLQMLYRISQEVDVYFKTDEPRKVRKWLNEMQETWQEKSYIKVGHVEDKSDKTHSHHIDLSNVVIKDVQILEIGELRDLKRLPRPGLEEIMSLHHKPNVK